MRSLLTSGALPSKCFRTTDWSLGGGFGRVACAFAQFSLHEHDQKEHLSRGLDQDPTSVDSRDGAGERGDAQEALPRQPTLPHQRPQVVSSIMGNYQMHGPGGQRERQNFARASSRQLMDAVRPCEIVTSKNLSSENFSFENLSFAQGAGMQMVRTEKSSFRGSLPCNFGPSSLSRKGESSGSDRQAAAAAAVRAKTLIGEASSSYASSSGSRNRTSWMERRHMSSEPDRADRKFSPDLMAALEPKMREIEGRHKNAEAELMKPDLSPDLLARLGKEMSELESALAAIRSLRSVQGEIEEFQSALGNSQEDEDVKELAAEELTRAEKEKEEALRAVLRNVLPPDEADSRACILEVRSGTGGDEAALFAADLFRMYERFSSRSGWRFDVVDIAEAEIGGYREASASISGRGAFGRLKFETGVHRVQRVPSTEKAGRVHTSAATVAVLPQAEEVDVTIRSEDLRIDTYRSGGAGGQSVNTTSSAVRVTHLPTGTVVAIQDERSQHQNKAKALKVLRAKLFEQQRQQQAAARSNMRQGQIGSGDRSERVRTYNFPQGRVTDHRVGITLHALDQLMEGDGLDTFIDALELEEEQIKIANLTDNRV